MNLPFIWLPAPLVVCSACAIAATILLGLVGTYKALGQKPAPVLRTL
jgi:putative ABC transport system permease protein